MLFIFNIILVFKLVESVSKKNSTSVNIYQEHHENEVELQNLACPPESHKLPFFGLKCKTNDDCTVPGEICCHEKNFKICRRGKIVGLGNQPRIRKECPSREALFEMLPIQNCRVDSDCGLWRICCPDGETSYCRRAVPQLNLIFSSDIIKTFNNMMSYLQCTSPPPPLLDFFAKPCKNVLDCFPNLCCQEKGRKVCRPSKRSIFPFLSSIT